jgi:hypothetical protein
MIKRTFTIEYREAKKRDQMLGFTVEIYKFQVFGITLWKREKLH